MRRWQILLDKPICRKLECPLEEDSAILGFHYLVQTVYLSLLYFLKDRNKDFTAYSSLPTLQPQVCFHDAGGLDILASLRSGLQSEPDPRAGRQEVFGLRLGMLRALLSRALRSGRTPGEAARNAQPVFGEMLATWEAVVAAEAAKEAEDAELFKHATKATTFQTEEVDPRGRFSCVKHPTMYVRALYKATLPSGSVTWMPAGIGSNPLD